MATQQRRPLGKVAGWGHFAPTKKLNISSDSPAHKNVAKVNTKVALNHLQTPVAVSNRFEPLDELEFSEISETLNDIDYKLSDLEDDLGILDLNSENTANGTNYDNFEKLLLKKRIDQGIVQQARSCPEYVACKQQMGNAFGVIPLSPLMLYQILCMSFYFNAFIEHLAKPLKIF